MDARNDSPGSTRLREGAIKAARIGILLVLTAACEPGAHAGAPISDEELTERIEQGAGPLILDVRSEQEYRAGHIPGARNIPYDQLPERLSELGISASEEVVVYCQSGRRAAAAAKVLVAEGFTQVSDLEGHMQGWRAAGLPTE